MQSKTTNVLLSQRHETVHNWKAVMDGYVLFRTDRLLRQGGGVALYVREQ